MLITRLTALVKIAKYPARLEQALAIHCGLGNRGGEAETLNETGTLHRLRGELAEAEARHQQARTVSSVPGPTRAADRDPRTRRCRVR
jgi:hypothetical protein